MDGELVKGCSLSLSLYRSLSLLSKKAKACFHTCGNSCYCSFSLVINKGSTKKIENISSSFLLHFLFLFFFSSKKFLLNSLQGDVWLVGFIPPREEKRALFVISSSLLFVVLRVFFSAFLLLLQPCWRVSSRIPNPFLR